MKLIWHINLGFITLSNKLITFFPPYRAAVAWSIIDSVFVFLRWRGLYRSSNRRRLIWATSVNSCTPQKWSEIETDPAGSLVDTHVAPFQTWSSFDIEWRRIYRDVSACSPVYMSERMMHVQHRMCECLECLKQCLIDQKASFRAYGQRSILWKEWNVENEGHTLLFHCWWWNLTPPLLTLHDVSVTSHSHFWWKCLYNSESIWEQLSKYGSNETYKLNENGRIGDTNWC